MTSTNQLPPDHPGEILRGAMNVRGLSADALAEALNIPTDQITAILNGQQTMSAETAYKLSVYFGTTSDFRLNLQEAWEKLLAETGVEERELVTFVPTKGSPVGGRHKDKKERITEALTDLRLVIGGFGTDVGQHERRDMPNMAQTLGAFARHCSIFLRKLILGDGGDRKTRLLDDTVMDSLDLRLQPLRKIPRRQRRTIRTGLAVGGGFMQLTKLDEPGPGPAPTQHLPVAPHDLEFVIEWPLPGTADWIGVPTPTEPWQICADQLFDTGSTRALNCDDWLGQQIVLFDSRGISLKDIIRMVATYEGAHAINVGRLLEVEGHKPFKPAKDPALHLLNNITLFGIRYPHLVVIESALYLYHSLLDEPSIRRPDGDIYQVTPSFECHDDQASSPRPGWLRFEGTIIATFATEAKVTRYTIRPAG